MAVMHDRCTHSPTDLHSLVYSVTCRDVDAASSVPIPRVMVSMASPVRTGAVKLHGSLPSPLLWQVR